MKQYFRTTGIYWLIAFLLSLGGWWFSSTQAYLPDAESVCFDRLTERWYEKEQLLQSIEQDLANFADFSPDSLWHSEAYTALTLGLLDEEVSLLTYYESQLVHWNTNRDFMPESLNEISKSERLLFFGNTWYVAYRKELKSYTWVLLVQVRVEYAYENEFLTNHYPAGFPSSCEGSYLVEFEEAGMPFYDSSGDYLFSLVFDEEHSSGNSGWISPLIPYLLFIFLLFVWMSERVARTRRFWPSFIGLSSAYLSMQILLFGFSWPGVVLELELFKPYQFAYSDWYASLGHYFITSIQLFLLLFGWLRYHLLAKQENAHRFLKIGLSLVLPILGFYALMLQWHLLIENSTIHFEVNRILETNSFTLIAFWIMALWVVIYLILSNVAISWIPQHARKNWVFIQVVLFAVLAGVMVVTQLKAFAYTAVLGFGLWFVLFLGRRTAKWLSYSSKLILLVLSAVLAALVIQIEGGRKKDELKTVYASNLANERDQIAEMFLMEIESRIDRDEYLANLLVSETDWMKVLDYVQEEYFSGYWNRYLLQGFWCLPGDSLYVEPEERVVPCISFFQELIQENAIKVSQQSFHYIDYNDGAITYLGKIHYPELEGVLILELNSRLVTNELGYPELLIEGEQNNELDRYGFSYAKYSDKQLITQSGSFDYPLQGDLFYQSQDAWSRIEWEGYAHRVYRIDADNVILVSSEAVTWLDLLVLLSYTFVIFHLSYTLLYFLLNFTSQLRDFRFNFKTRIQFSMIMVVVLTMLLIGGGTVYFSVKQFNNKHYDILNEKIQSVLVELEHKLARENSLESDQIDYITSLLIKFSNVFYSDINLYRLDGKLLATSRSEVFDKRLSGRVMNPEAYRALHSGNKALFVHKESIGQLSYLSAYVPFRNQNNEILAYLNLPYFTRQGLIIKEISGLVTAVTNIYLLLILFTLVVTLLVSKKITRPLEQLQQKLGSIDLRKRNEKIVYEQQDEIGDLIHDYNRMVEELERSAELLARSERESAWREMARQIAHEIKNPLTPMRLHIQYLQKLMQDEGADYRSRIENTAAVLIHQIDSLNEIATDFSNFASIRQARRESVSLYRVAEEVLNLYRPSEQASFQLQAEKDEEYIVEANSEQIRRMLINLIKNSLQSILPDRPGRIELRLRALGSEVEISIRDNGKGISPEVQEKIFQPYFTTKSSGMGLGLAIVKGIVDEWGGSIEFTTDPGSGTQFTIRFPVG